MVVRIWAWWPRQSRNVVINFSSPKTWTRKVGGGDRGPPLKSVGDQVVVQFTADPLRADAQVAANHLNSDRDREMGIVGADRSGYRELRLSLRRVHFISL